MAVTPEMVTGWSRAFVEKPLSELIPVGMDVNRWQGWAHPTELEGAPSVRQVLVNRLGQDLVDAEVKAQAKDIWPLIKGFGLQVETFTYTDGNEDETVLLGEFCVARGKALPESATVVAEIFEVSSSVEIAVLEGEISG
jgi:hypothetical protein